MQDLSVIERNVYRTDNPINQSGEPLKKKRRIDPTVEQNRQKRKLRKIEKEIKRLTRFERNIIPIEEIEGDRQLLHELSIRKRQEIDLSENELDRRDILWKKWNTYQTKVCKEEMKNYCSALRAQDKALHCLHETRPDLYKSAIQLCATCENELSEQDEIQNNLLPITLIGPYTTPPMLFNEKIESTNGYDPPDGERIDITSKITYDFELDRQFLVDPKGGRKSTFRNKS